MAYRRGLAMRQLAEQRRAAAERCYDDFVDLSVVLITANVGSLFEKGGQLQENWLTEIYRLIKDRNANVVALHCQEMGGKSFEQAVEGVDDFVRRLLAADELREFDRVRMFIDKCYENQDEFTALGSFYFIHKDIKDVAIWDFSGNTFEEVKGRKAEEAWRETTGTTFYWKVKFSPSLFPMFPLSRKGFIRTRWRLSERIFDFVNLHVFADTDNILSSKEGSSVYAECRKDAMEYTLHRLDDALAEAPVFLFGDFNFRPDLPNFIKSYLPDCRVVEEVKSGTVVRRSFYKPDETEPALFLERKCFKTAAPLDFTQLKEFDKENNFPQIYEQPVVFDPSYPYQEDSNDYEDKRCPSWCDRVLFNPKGQSMLMAAHNVIYDVVGRDVCMGDHKPVAISFVLGASQFRQPLVDSRKIEKYLRAKSTTHLDLTRREKVNRWRDVVISGVAGAVPIALGVPLGMEVVTVVGVSAVLSGSTYALCRLLGTRQSARKTTGQFKFNLEESDVRRDE